MDSLFEPTLLRLFIQMFLATLLGFAIGAERTVAGKTAGMRTFALIALGSCLFTTIGIIVSASYVGTVNFDPLRVTAAIISGIGFIGAGLMIFRDNAVHGLTTAAGIWVTAGVGIAVGFGLYAVAIFVTILMLFIFTSVWFIEERMRLTLGRAVETRVEDLTTVEKDINE